MRKWRTRFIFIILMFLVVFNVLLLMGAFEKVTAQCIPVDSGLNDPNAAFCVLADKSVGCPIGFDAKTRRHIIPTTGGQTQRSLGLYDGFVGPSGAWNLQDNYGWHCGADFNYCNEDDQNNFQTAEYYCCKNM